MIFKKKQLILAALVVALGAAIYLNWQFSDEKSLSVTGALDTSPTESVKNLGDAQFVNNPQSSAEAAAEDANYFVKARLNREQARTAALEIVNNVINNVKTEEAAKKEAIDRVAQISRNVETEAKVENLIKAKGFQDAVVSIEEKNCDVVVPAAELQPNQIIQIKDIVTSTANIPAENIKIINVK